MRSRRSLVLVTVVAAVLAGCGDDGGVNSGDVTGSSTSGVSTSVGTSTTAGSSTSAGESTTVVPSTTEAAPTTSAATTPSTTVAPAPTAAPATTTPGSSLLPPNTKLQPSAALTFALPAGDDFCTDFVPPGWVPYSCANLVSLANFYVVVQRQAGDGHFRVVLMVPTSGTDYQSEYIAEEPAAGTWSDVKVVHGSFHFGSGPFNGDGEGLWVGYRYEGTGQYLDLDVVEWNEDGTATRGALKELDHGAVHVRPGGADIVTAVYGPSDPGCCPSQVLKQTLTYVASSNRWRIDAGTLLAPDDPAASVTSDF